MKSINSKVFGFIIIVESIIFMLPTTLMLVAGMALSLLGFFQGNRGAFTPAYLYVFTFLALLGFALYSLWWLVIFYKKLTLSTIPVHIWLGLVIGAVVAVLVIFPFRLGEPGNLIGLFEYLRIKLVFGLGPLITVITLLLGINFQSDSGKSLQKVPPALDSL